jgi:hypothetical protein
MRISGLGILILTWAVVAGTTTAQAQTYVTVGVPNSGVTNSSNGTVAMPTDDPTANVVAFAGNAKSSEDAIQLRTYAFETIPDPVITAVGPSTMLLFGSGLLLIAGVLRRRLRPSKSK